MLVVRLFPIELPPTPPDSDMNDGLEDLDSLGA